MAAEIDMTRAFVVILHGGTIGQTGTIFKRGVVVSTFDDKAAAQEYSKRRNKGLSKGEKSYYRMKYECVANSKANMKGGN